MRRSLAFRAAAAVVTVLFAVTGCAVAGPPADGPGGIPAPDARSVVERFADALEAQDCAELFATTTEPARAGIGVSWSTVEDCLADPGSAPEGNTASVGEVTEEGDLLATAEVTLSTQEGVAATFHLTLTRVLAQEPWVITDAEYSLDAAPQPSPEPSTGERPDPRREFLFLAQDFISALASRDCFAFKIMTTREFWAEFATNAGAIDVCDVVENGNTAPWEDMTVLNYGTIDHEGALWDQELKYGFWHEEGAPGSVGAWKISSFRSNGSPVPHR
ncbi:MAG: hypothetical protein KF680_09175 [Cryobacterium sp.]|nr:hypothetical protein [Cryobacterium sp.]